MRRCLLAFAILSSSAILAEAQAPPERTQCLALRAKAQGGVRLEGADVSTYAQCIQTKQFDSAAPDIKGLVPTDNQTGNVK
jgi:hypothetical protein